MKQLSLSVCLATYNEEANIEACLKSIKSIAAEIIVVDGSSTDKTREIAKKLGAKVYKVTNKPIFHINKNIAIRKCKGDWIYQLDADEITPPELSAEIKKVVAGEYNGFTDWKANTPYPVHQDPPVAFWLKRRNLFLNRYLKKTGQYPDPVIRLFKKGLARLPAKDVHEQMMVKGNTAWLKHDLLHNATPTFSRYLIRENRYSSLEAQLLLNRGVKVNPVTFINFIFLKPTTTFLMLYIRHKGFQDGFPGFVFSLFSALHHPLSFIKLWELRKNERNLNIKTDWN